MGQTTSTPTTVPPVGSAERQHAQPSRSSSTQASRRRPATFWRRPTESPNDAPSHDASAPRPRTNRPRPASVNRLSQLFLSPEQTPELSQRGATSTAATDSSSSQRPSFAARLQRHSLFLGAPNSLFARRSRPEDGDADDTSSSLWPSEESSMAADTSAGPRAPSSASLTLPRVEVPDLDLDFTLSSSASGPATSRTPSRRPSTRLASTLSDRLAAIRPNRHQANGSAMLRRRRSPLAPGEENTVLLSRLLSVAAATTAETLLEGSGETMANARGHATEGDDGSFGSFLQSLESGRLAAALRQPMQPPPGTPPSAPAPLNFFRVFRFGAQPASRTNGRTGENGDHRMVPIIIVGIRAVPQGAAVSGSEEGGIPPFLDALSNLPTTPLNPSLGQELGETLRGPQNGSRFSARRRASMGGLSRFPLGYDNQRHHRSPERQRPASVASEMAAWPRPPPATPASPSLSNVTSHENTPAPTVPPSRRSSYSGTPRRESIIRTTTTTTLETTTEEAVRTRPPRQRRMSDSEHRNSFPSTRRNGIVEPDNANLPENTRSWIIYVLGGSYPENHPILTTPSLFTDSPTYEDMMLLSSLLGPVKPPVATESDIAQAGGIYRIEEARDEKGETRLVAAAIEGEARVELADEQRCLVCLCDMEKGEEARRLTDCGHLFHRECIDEWLTKGRNSCPLCRAQGVQEKKKEEKIEAPPVDSTAPSPVIPSEPGRAVAAQ